MFEGFKGKIDQLKLVQKMLKDENIRKLMMHPKFQALVQDPEFLQAAKSQDMQQLSRNPKFAAIGQDAELRELMSKIDFKNLL